MSAKFNSRKSFVLGFIIWGLLSLICFITCQPHFSAQNYKFLLFFWILVFFVIGILWFGTRYIIIDDTLHIKIGPISERKIKIEHILSLERSYSVLSSPANALKRLEVNYRGGMVLISPKREGEFLKLLKSINPGIEFLKLR